MKSILSTLFLLMLLVTGARAQWQQAGIYGGSVNAFTASGMRTFAATNYGIFYSDNNGDSWAEVSNFPLIRVRALATNGSTILAGTDQGLWTSSDNGASWTQQLVAPLSATTIVNAIMVNPAPSNKIYLGTNSGIYTSANGINWTANNTGLGSLWVTALSGNGSTIYAGVMSDGIYRSLNDGASWTRVLSNFSGPVNAITINNTSVFSASGSGFHRSTDGGNTWVNMSGGDRAIYNLPATTFTSILAQGSRIYATSFSDTYYSTNNGDYWTYVAGAGGYANALGNNGSTLFIGRTIGIYRSVDQGVSWQRAQQGLNPIEITDVTYANSRLFTSIRQGRLTISDDEGSSFSEINIATYVVTSANSQLYLVTENGGGTKIY